MNPGIPDFKQALQMATRVDPQYRPAWERRPPEQQVALARYFLPHHSTKATLTPTRPRIIKWYCPFACQSAFPSGHRYCINVFTGCAHKCEYCYALGYSPETPSCKKGFEQIIDRDMDDLERFDVPPAPVHLSNSTDPFQRLEATCGHTRYALEQILAHRRRFTSVRILTKNPLMPIQLGNIDLFKKLIELPADHPCSARMREHALPGFCVEISLAFWREESRAAYDPGAPTVEERKDGIRAFRQAGIPIVLRIDPLFPRVPLGPNPARAYASFGLSEPQSAEDIDNLVGFAKAIGALYVVHSPAKLVQPRGRKLSAVMQAMRRVYACVAAPDKPIFRGGAWRLPDAVVRTQVTEPFLETCRRIGVVAKYCKHNLIDTP